MTSRVYAFHKNNRLDYYINDCDNLDVLTWSNLFSLNESDVIVTPRPWCILFEALFFFKSNRPLLIQFADGYNFLLNSKKKKNRRYGYLYRSLFSDAIFVRQNASFFNDIIEGGGTVESFLSFSVRSAQKIIKEKKIILIASNDPAFGRSKKDVIEIYAQAAIRLEKLGAQKIVLSAPQSWLRKGLKEKCPSVDAIGRLSESDLDFDSFIAVGTPGTLIMEWFLDSRPSYIFDEYLDNELKEFFLPVSSILSQESVERPWCIQYLLPAELKRQAKISTHDLLSLDIKKKKCEIHWVQFFINFRLRLFFRELVLLFFQNK